MTTAPITLPCFVADEDDDEQTVMTGAALRRVLFEPEAEFDEPTGCRALFAVTAGGQTDVGRKRRANEDAMLVLAQKDIYVVADGMGGHHGGQIASRLAVEAIESAFVDGLATPCGLEDVPVRAAELVESLAAANEAIRNVAAGDAKLSEMGTTVVAARFCRNKGRLYIGHVGDSRCYRLRDGKFEQITRDHTLAELGVVGDRAGQLARAVGPRSVVEADLAVLEPRFGDVYLLCSDGLTKMLADDDIRGVLVAVLDPDAASSELVARANARGGADNVTAIVLRIAEVAAG